MTSFMQTMFVPLSSSPIQSTANPPSPGRCHYPYAAKPLSPLHSNVFAASTSSLGAPILWPESPVQVLESPLHKHFRNVLQTSSSSASLFGSNCARSSIAQTAVTTTAVPEVEPLHDPSSESAQPSLLSGSPTKRNKVCLPRSKAGRQRRPERSQSPDRGLGFGLEDIGLRADLLTMDSNANARGRASFKPQRSHKGSNAWQLKQFAEATLGNGSLKKVVKLPEGEDRDEWLAVNIVDFYNQVNLLYGAITEFCSPQSCPEMKATDEFEYLWHHPPAFPKPTRLPAPTYISNLLSWTSALLSDPTLFPTQPGVAFPEKFYPTVRQIFKRLYRVYAHIYCHHYSVIRGLGLEAHLNTGFKHYVLFVEEFGLADQGEGRREWFGPLGELVESMIRSD